MASAEVAQMSSPTRHFSIYIIPSSPLPTISEVMQQRKQAIKTGSRAAPIPQNASASFANAASLLKKPLEGSSQVDSIQAFRFGAGKEPGSEESLFKASKSIANAFEELDEKATKTRKPAAKKKDAIVGGVEVKPARKSRAKKAVADTTTDQVMEDAPEVVKKPRKPRAKKADTEIIAGGEPDGEEDVPKPARKAKKADKEGGNAVVKPAKRAKKSKSTSQTKLPAGKVTKSIASSGLVKAVERKITWTPPKSTKESIDVVEVMSDDIFASGGSIQTSKQGFGNLLEGYGFVKPSSTAPERLSAKVEGGGTRKRKLVELVKTGVSKNSSTTPKPKEKAPRKKPRTLTDLATSAYAQDEPVKPPPLLQYFSFQTTERSTSNGSEASKSRSRSPVKAAGKPKKGSAEAPILLSPESALKQVRNQDFVFGTSSQLARESSPTLLRDLHEAMQASNEVEDDPFADSDLVSPVKLNLWSAAARDASGKLLEIEVVDLSKTPNPIKHAPPITIVSSTEPLEEVDMWDDIDDISPPLVAPISAATDQEPAEVAPIPIPAAKPAVPGTDYNAYTTAQLMKAIAKFGFKPIKKREGMIALLEKCEEEKFSSTLSVMDTNFKVSKRVTKPATKVPKVAESPKRPRGRPRKDASTTTSPVSKASKEAEPVKRQRGRPKKDASADASPKAKQTKVSKPKVTDTVAYLEMDGDTPLSQIRTPKKATKKKTKAISEEISDSDAPLTPSPRRKKSKTTTEPLPLDSAELSLEQTQEVLFTHITIAVTSASPSTDPRKPSFHEKILLYDPIILEDLAVWLNTGALEKIGWDGEVDAKDVKKWCESKSICCLWKENLRGGARARY